MRWLALALAVGTVSCGYHAAGKADLIPDTVHSIAIPAFNNATVRYKLTDQLPQAISREIISRTRYRIEPNPDKADAIVYGTVTLYNAFPTVFDPQTNRQSAVELHVFMQVRMVERATGRVLFSRPNMEMRDRYQIAVNPAAFIEESDAALTRASSMVARQVVSSILENF